METMKNSLRALRHIMLPVLLVFAVSAGAQNLLVNGELMPDGGGWQQVKPGSEPCASLRWDPSGFVEAAFSCAEKVVDAGWRQQVPIVAEGWYRIRVRAAASGLSGDGDAELTFRSSSGTTLWRTGVESFAGSFGWDELAWKVRAPAGATSVEVFIGVHHGQVGAARFDEVALELQPSGGLRELVVDLGRPVGTVRVLNQTNRGPRLVARSGELIDYTARLQAAGVRRIRAHDVHTAFDTSVIFPDPQADPSDPASYRFASTDAAIAEARAGGFEVLFRLGESYGGPKTPRMAPEKWAEVVRHIVLHVNQGWANGSTVGIRYWEIWNEANGPLFWSGTPEEFYDLFARAAVAVRAADPAALVGGPGLAGHTHEAWVRGLLRHVRAAGAPLDFFSWHIYHMGNPHTLARAQLQLRTLLDEEGFAGAELFNTEWNLSGGAGCESTGCHLVIEWAYNAAHAAAAMIHLQDTDIPMAFRYRTDGTGMFGLCGDGREEPEWSRSGLAFRLWAELAGTPVRVEATGGDEEGLAVLAGRSDHGRSARVLVVNQGSADPGYRLSLRGLPAHFVWELLEISDARPCVVGDCAPRLVASGTGTTLPSGVLEAALAAPAVHLLRIEATAGGRTPRRHLSGGR
jgi:hypothetical protein